MATHTSILVGKNPRDREAWWATVHGVAKSWTQLKRLSTAHGTGDSSQVFWGNCEMRTWKRKCGLVIGIFNYGLKWDEFKVSLFYSNMLFSMYFSSFLQLPYYCYYPGVLFPIACHGYHVHHRWNHPLGRRDPRGHL